LRDTCADLARRDVDRARHKGGVLRRDEQARVGERVGRLVDVERVTRPHQRHRKLEQHRREAHGALQRVEPRLVGELGVARHLANVGVRPLHLARHGVDQALDQRRPLAQQPVAHARHAQHAVDVLHHATDIALGSSAYSSELSSPVRLRVSSRRDESAQTGRARAPASS
jgi:hypothetical protein